MLLIKLWWRSQDIVQMFYQAFNHDHRFLFHFIIIVTISCQQRAYKKISKVFFSCENSVRLRNSVINLWNSGSTESLSRSARYSTHQSLWEFSSLRNSVSNLWNSGWFSQQCYSRANLAHKFNTSAHTHTHTHTQAKQLEADIERLTSDKADLVTRLQCCEEDLKAANECEN